MSMKTGLMGAFVAVMALSAPIAAMADEAAAEPPKEESWIPGTFTGNVALTSDYVFRGISQSYNNVAIQGGMDWDTGVGLHFGTWGSSINFKDGGEAQAEIDLYGGYAGKIGDNFSYDVGFIYYWYPAASHLLHYNYWEVYGKAAYDFGVAAVNAGINYSPNNTGDTGNATYISSGLSVPVTSKLSITGGIDYYFLDQNNTPVAAFFPDYWDWNIGAKLNVNNWFNVDVRYYDTDIKGSCPLGVHKICGSKAVLTLSRSF